MYPYLRIQVFLAISISTGDESGYYYYISALDVIYDLFYILGESLKNHKPCYHSLSHIDSSNNSIPIMNHHHNFSMSFLLPCSEPTFNKTKWCFFPRITYTNYCERNVIILVLSATGVNTIPTRDNPEL